MVGGVGAVAKGMLKKKTSRGARARYLTSQAGPWVQGGDMEGSNRAEWLGSVSSTWALNPDPSPRKSSWVRYPMNADPRA